MADSYRTLLLSGTPSRTTRRAWPTTIVRWRREVSGRPGLAGDWLRAHGPEVDAVLCSTAARTRATLERTRIDAPVDFVDRLYDATPGAVIDVINGVQSRFDSDVQTLLVIGHEPAMSAVALGLAAADGSNATAAERISTKFPTSAIAMLRTNEPWDQLALSGAALVTFHVARASSGRRRLRRASRASAPSISAPSRSRRCPGTAG